MVREMRDIYAQLQEIFAEGIYEGGKNHVKMGVNENTTGEGGVRYKVLTDVLGKDGNVYHMLKKLITYVIITKGGGENGRKSNSYPCVQGHGDSFYL